MRNGVPSCPKCKVPLRAMEVPKVVQLGATILAGGAFIFVVIPLVVIAGSWLDPSLATWGAIEYALLAALSALLGGVGYLIKRANQEPLYRCEACHRRFNWRSLANSAMKASGGR